MKKLKNQTFLPPAKDSPNPYERLSHLKKMGNGVGLHRISWLVSDLLAQPWLANLQSIRVTGSNGKGSVCAMLDSIFEALGIERGLYISPHLVRFNERFSLNGNLISDEELMAAIDWFLAREREYSSSYPDDSIGLFEAYTAIALQYFDHHKPDVLVAEAGIGGRYDATRVLPGNLVGLTSLDLEHADLLGNSLELIAYDKADLCPTGGTLVVGKIDPEVLRRLRAYCDLRKVNLVSTEELLRVKDVSFTHTTTVASLSLDGMEFDHLQIGLPGRHQINNAAVAILLAQRWIEQEKPTLSAEDFRKGIYEGLRTVRWPGRFQRIQEKPEIYIDVGHTPDAIDRVVETVQDVLPGKPILLVTGVSRDKQVEKIVSKLAKIATRVICTRAYHRGRDASEIFRLVRNQYPEIPVDEAATIEQATALALKLAKENNMTILVAGGLFLAIEAMVAFQGNDPQALRFH